MLTRQRSLRRRRPLLEQLEGRLCLTAPASNSILGLASPPHFFPEPIQAGKPETMTFVLQDLVNITGGPSLVSGFSDGNNDNFAGSKINFDNQLSNPANGPGDVSLTDANGHLLLGTGTLSNGDAYTASLGSNGAPATGTYTITITHTYPTSAIGTSPALVLTLDDITTGTFSPPAGPPPPINGVVIPYNMLGQTINGPPTITSANNVTFTAGQANTFQVTTTGFPIPTLKETGTLPAGVTFVDNRNGTGTLSGNPTSATGSPFALTFTAANTIASSPPTNGSISQPFTLTIKAQGQAPTITSANSTTFLEGSSSNSFTVTATGTPAPHLTASGLPNGVTLTDNGDGTATLHGNPTENGGFGGITITASNGVTPDFHQSFTLTIDEAPKLVSFTNVGIANHAASTTQILAVQSFPISKITATGTLPPGVTFVDNGNNTATITGTPNVPASAFKNGDASFPIIVTADNKINPPVVQPISIDVRTDLSKPVITGPTSVSVHAGHAISGVVWNIEGNPLPTIGLSGNSPNAVNLALPTITGDTTETVDLIGTPAAAAVGTYHLNIAATNSQGATFFPFTLIILPTTTNQQVVRELAQEQAILDIVAADEFAALQAKRAHNTALETRLKDRATTELAVAVHNMSVIQQDISNDLEASGTDLRAFNTVGKREQAEISTDQNNLSNI